MPIDIPVATVILDAEGDRRNGVGKYGVQAILPMRDLFRSVRV